MMVLPRDGLKDPAGNPVTYDKAYTVGEFDLYIPQDETFATVESTVGSLKSLAVLAKICTLVNGSMRWCDSTPCHIAGW